MMLIKVRMQMTRKRGQNSHQRKRKRLEQWKRERIVMTIKRSNLEFNEEYLLKMDCKAMNLSYIEIIYK